ncbi:hypothetical protein CDIK_1817 [Cucumispora dikerogammari]|nr:hypothetical protein CDIK_1817 [Cucumispora dikerogammari]
MLNKIISSLSEIKQVKPSEIEIEKPFILRQPTIYVPHVVDTNDPSGLTIPNKDCIYNDYKRRILLEYIVYFPNFKNNDHMLSGGIRANLENKKLFFKTYTKKQTRNEIYGDETIRPITVICKHEELLYNSYGWLLGELENYPQMSNHYTFCVAILLHRFYTPNIGTTMELKTQIRHFREILGILENEMAEKRAFRFGLEFNIKNVSTGDVDSFQIWTHMFVFSFNTEGFSIETNEVDPELFHTEEYQDSTPFIDR